MLNLTQSRKVGRSIMSKNIYSKMSQIRERHPSVSEQCYHREPSLFFTSVSDSTRSQFTRGGGKLHWNVISPGRCSGCNMSLSSRQDVNSDINCNLKTLDCRLTLYSEVQVEWCVRIWLHLKLKTSADHYIFFREAFKSKQAIQFQRQHRPKTSNWTRNKPWCKDHPIST